MKKILLLTPLLLSLAFSARADFLLQPNDVLAIAGDSITQQRLYTVYMEEYLLMCQPTLNQRVIQFGWNGETASAFLARMNNDVLPFKPTVVTTCYGMNDGNYTALANNGDDYRKTQTDIVEALKKNGVRVIVLASPKCVETKFYNRNPPPAGEIYNKTLAAFADIDKDIAAKEGIVYADVYDAMVDVMKKAKAKYGDDYSVGGHDGIHPGPNGQLVMAYVMLKALGCDGNIGTITVDMAQQKATGTPGQEILSCKDGAVEVKSTRYPFCFTTYLAEKDENMTGFITSVFPFNEDLNRYMLVVNGLTTPKAKITWGTVTKEYASADLAKGINLASEFIDKNPFYDPFMNVAGAIQPQQDYDMFLIQNVLHNIPLWTQQLGPDAGSGFDQAAKVGMAKQATMFKHAAELVVPVQHTIKIEPTP